MEGTEEDETVENTLTDRLLRKISLCGGLRESFGVPLPEADLTVAHVFELSSSLLIMNEAGVSPEWYEERKQYARRTLDEFCTNHLRGMPVQRELLDGNPAHAIVTFAHDKQMEMIVIPTHGYGAFRRFILGSVTA